MFAEFKNCYCPVNFNYQKSAGDIALVGRSWFQYAADDCLVFPFQTLCYQAWQSVLAKAFINSSTAALMALRTGVSEIATDLMRAPEFPAFEMTLRKRCSQWPLGANVSRLDGATE